MSPSPLSLTWAQRSGSLWLRRKSGTMEGRALLVLVLILTLTAVATDQLLAQILRTTTPLLAAVAFLLLVWRSNESISFEGNVAASRQPTVSRIVIFFSLHFMLVLFSRSISSTAEPFSGTASALGTFIGLGKLVVLAPSAVLLPFASWQQVLRAYRPEFKAALLVLLIHVPRRILEFLWPWYGRILAWSVYSLARWFVPGLLFDGSQDPTLLGPYQDTIIVPACSGIDAFEVLGYVFCFAVLLDWNSLRKGRAFIVYLGALISMLVSNVFRLVLFVILGNGGLARYAPSFHALAGMLFFCIIFVLYLLPTYRWMRIRLPIH